MQNRLVYFVSALFLTITGCGQPSVDQADSDLAAEGSDNPNSGLNSPKTSSPGSIAFIRCAACHAVTTDSVSKIGPNLSNIFNQPAGQVSGYDYSEALSSSQKVWDRQTLMRFLNDPGAEIVGTKMVFAGIENEEERTSIINYLEALSVDGR